MDCLTGIPLVYVGRSMERGLIVTIYPESVPVVASPSNSIWPYLSSDLVRSEREYC